MFVSTARGNVQFDIKTATPIGLGEAKYKLRSWGEQKPASKFLGN